ncbi:hypothetical protein LF63_0106435 [Oleiagrimonas soli]|uniref:Uncharacterized protein n=1 Tax=Oleiagrimonas soli TaxID=1543381 RepID=A0A099CWJ9_9GAMM|nr:hypothetical protein LF63_0106435 [Oleiagrimonas soli]
MFVGRKQENPARGRVFVVIVEQHATAYPAGNKLSGRRAREVMPAAMRALVRIAGAAVWDGFTCRARGMERIEVHDRPAARKTWRMPGRRT